MWCSQGKHRCWFILGRKQYFVLRTLSDVGNNFSTYEKSSGGRAGTAVNQETKCHQWIATCWSIPGEGLPLSILGAHNMSFRMRVRHQSPILIRPSEGVAAVHPIYGTSAHAARAGVLECRSFPRNLTDSNR